MPKGYRPCEPPSSLLSMRGGQAGCSDILLSSQCSEGRGRWILWRLEASQGYRGDAGPARPTEGDPVSNMYLEATQGNLVKSSDSITDRQAWHAILSPLPFNCITGLGLRFLAWKTRTIITAAGDRDVECDVRLWVAYNTTASGNLRSPQPPVSSGTSSSFGATS